MWLATAPDTAERHVRRVNKMDACCVAGGLATTDVAIFQAVKDEERRQRENLELIASENYTSRAV